MGRQPCTICASAIAQQVNAELEKKTRLIDIAALSGFSKSAIGRHRLNCWPRQKISAHKSKKYQLHQRALVDNGDGTATVRMSGAIGTPQDTIVAISDLRPDDVLLRIVFSSPSPRPAPVWPLPEDGLIEEPVPAAELNDSKS